MTGFLLTQEAKKGDPFAQHELGLRYLLGRGFAPDTVAAVQWIKKAANQKLAAAQFNYAIMLINGLGTNWNPFEAFERFKYAAESKMPEAQYMYGSLLTDNLIVNKDMTEAYKWIKKASDAGYEPAAEALKSMMESGMVLPADPNYNNNINAQLDSSALSNFSGALTSSPIELDFYDFSSDSVTHDEKLIREIFDKNYEEVKNILGIRNSNTDSSTVDSTISGLIKFASESGSPEALILEAKSYENGYKVKKDLILAAEKYIRSLRLGSQRSAAFLLKLIKENKFMQKLEKGVNNGEPDAKYVWAGLVALGFNYSITGKQALELLESAADEGHIYSIIELGLCYYNGNLVDKDRNRAVEYWQKAHNLGSEEGRIRIILDRVRRANKSDNFSQEIKILKRNAAEGSVLAEMALAYCYEFGIGLPVDKAEAVKYYRRAAQRGNEAAYNSLLKIYDSVRPNDDKYNIVE